MGSNSYSHDANGNTACRVVEIIKKPQPKSSPSPLLFYHSFKLPHLLHPARTCAPATLEIFQTDSFFRGLGGETSPTRCVRAAQPSQKIHHPSPKCPTTIKFIPSIYSFPSRTCNPPYFCGNMPYFATISVTYVSKRLLPICQVYTHAGEAKTTLSIKPHER